MVTLVTVFGTLRAWGLYTEIIRELVRNRSLMSLPIPFPQLVSFVGLLLLTVEFSSLSFSLGGMWLLIRSRQWC